MNLTILPPLGNLEAYITAVNKLPYLTLEEEVQYAKEMHEGNQESAHKLVLSHLRLVVATSRNYTGYGLPQADIIQEGNVGLMKAVKRFKPQEGSRLVGYAMHWIKAEIHEYVIKNWKMVKVATTKPQRKLFFNLRSMRNKFQDEDEQNSGSLTPEQRKGIALKLNVKESEVEEMEVRMTGGDVLLDPISDDSEEEFGPISYLTDENDEPINVIERHNHEVLLHEGIEEALMSLDERSQTIVRERWLNVSETGVGKTLADLAEQYKVSGERIRQIETQAMKKMKKALIAFSEENAI